MERQVSQRFWIATLSIGIIAALVIWSGCADNTLVTDSDDDGVHVSDLDAALSKAAAARQAVGDDLLDREGIEGIGTRLNPGGQPQLVIYAHSNAAAAAANIPSHVEGVPTSVLVTGLIIARSDETSKARPTPIGFSVGHPDITAGTIGARVKNGNNIFILSNNHVLANSNEASVGDATLQPGPIDGGTSADAIGTLADFQPISFSGNNTMDAAIASVSSSDLDGATPLDEGYGAPNTVTKPASLGMLVQKYGRTTGHTQGQVAEINVTVDVCYVCANPVCTRCAESARFVDQIGISDGAFSAGGDSGSLIVSNDDSKNPVGLLFAGGSNRTFANPIQPVLNRFGVTIDPTTNESGEPTNAPPTASFTYSCTDLDCDFDGSGSSDSDGSIVAYAWDFGDDGSATQQTASHTFTSDGTYTVSLTVTDDEGATGSANENVNVSSGSTGGITLSTTGYKVRGLHKADLTWSGATSANVDVRRDGSIITTISDNGKYTDDMDQRGSGSYSYQVCEAGSSTCSNTSTVTF
jgi:PKD repeat protein